MKKRLFSTGLILYCLTFSVYGDTIIKILKTSYIHGNFSPFDFIENRPAKGSLSRIYTYVKQERKKGSENLLLLDNGDILQGQPTAYYYNFIDANSVHLTARLMNFMKYKTATMGNHDIETGPAVYDRFVRSCNFPWLATNAIRENSDKSYFTPYYIHEVSGIRMAILGMITPAIPVWLPKNLWKDMYYKDIQSTARQWMKAEKVIKSEIISNWKFIPETWAKSAGKRDYDLLF
jgi:2',3'-cyclic-nucleotide 2'-phosphodiesterase/3'-nucleotidase